jgi:hypothetical protein
MTNPYTEAVLVEQPAIARFARMGWQTANCFDETFSERGTLGRETSAALGSGKMPMRRAQVAMTTALIIET